MHFWHRVVPRHINVVELIHRQTHRVRKTTIRKRHMHDTIKKVFKKKRIRY